MYILQENTHLSPSYRELAWMKQNTNIHQPTQKMSYFPNFFNNKFSYNSELSIMHSNREKARQR